MRRMPPPGSAALRAAVLLFVGGGALGGCGTKGDGAACLTSGCGGAAGGGRDGAGGDLATDNDAGAIAPGLLAMYDFDQTAGGSVALDTSGNFNNAGLIGQVAWGTMGHAGGDVSFTGGYLVLPPMLDDARTFSFTAWVKLRSDRIWQRVFDFGNGTGNYMFLTPHSAMDNTFRFAITRAGAGAEQRLDGPTPLPTGVWKHVAVVLTGASGTLYLDGQPVATGADVTFRPADVAPFGNSWIGRSEFSTDPALDGEIDQVRIYNRALSASEVLALFGSP
jgi:hypothetical protein